MTPLMYQCQKGNLESVKQLLENGADVSIRDNSNQNAFDYAQLGPNADECLQILLKGRAIIEEAEFELQQASVKVVLLGEPGAGKTTLLKRLRSLEDGSGLRGNFPKGDHPNMATDGIEITQIHNTTKTNDDVAERWSLIFF
jgi:ankyrin repeat protein